MKTNQTLQIQRDHSLSFGDGKIETNSLYALEQAINHFANNFIALSGPQINSQVEE